MSHTAVSHVHRDRIVLLMSNLKPISDAASITTERQLLDPASLHFFDGCIGLSIGQPLPPGVAQGVFCLPFGA